VVADAMAFIVSDTWGVSTKTRKKKKKKHI